MVALIDSLESFSMDHFEDIHPIFKDVEEQQTIDTSQCLIIIKLLRLCKNLCKDVEKKNFATVKDLSELIKNKIK